jgi:hypothetical protein
MNKISLDSLANIEFRLKSKCSDAAHTEAYFGRHVDLRGDILLTHPHFTYRLTGAWNNGFYSK